MIRSPALSCRLLLTLPLLAGLVAQDPVLLRDFDPNPDGSTTSSIARQFARDASGRVFFVGWGTGSKAWLYVTRDGTIATTTPLVGFQFSYNAPVTGEVTAFGNGVLFRANDGIHGMEPWYSDGTITGTYMLADLEPGSEGSDPSSFTASGDTALFIARTTSTGTELFRTQGAYGDVTLVRDVYPGRGDSQIGALTAVGDRWFFHADVFPLGDELWVSDGTPFGTIAVSDLLPGQTGATPRDLARLGNRLVFTAALPATGRELWITDGTPGGTSLVADLRAGQNGSDPTGTVSAGDRVYFSADDGTAGRELWVSDGSAAGTRLFADVAAGAASSRPESLIPTPTGDAVYFTAEDGLHGREPWISDGSDAGTVLLTDATPGASGSAPTLFAPVGDRLWFTADDPQVGRELWSSDGTPSGTSWYADLHPGTEGSLPSEVTAVGDGNAVLFAAEEGVRGREAWLIDDAGGAPLRLGVRERFRKTGSPVWLAIGTTPSGMLFSPSVGGLWFSDGTPTGTRYIHRMSVYDTFQARDGVFLSGSDSATGGELYYTDGTTAGTRLVADLRDGPRSSSPSAFTTIDDQLVFSAKPNGVDALYRSDGTAAGTVLLDAWNGAALYNDSPKTMLRLGAEVYYVTAPGNSPDYLYATDGRTTREVRALGSSFSYSVREFGRAGDRLFFDMGDATTGREPWSSDGTRAGTGPIRNLQPGSLGSDPREFTALGDRVYFSAFRADLGRELWTSDGTDAGTMLVTDLWPGREGADPRHLTVLGDRLLFAAATPGEGHELWSTDGTAAGTVRIAEFFPGPRSGDPASFLLDGAGHALFAATEPTTGRELWRTDGRTVERLTDLAPGEESSSPEPRALVGNRLIFLADDGRVGREPWALEIGPTVVASVPPCAPPGRAPELRTTAPRLGGVTLLEGEGAPAGGWFVVALGLPAVRPPLWPNTAICRSAIDPSAATLLASGSVTGSRWAAALVVPDVAALQGLTLGVQAALGPTDGPGGADWTNGLRLALGR